MTKPLGWKTGLAAKKFREEAEAELSRRSKAIRAYELRGGGWIAYLSGSVVTPVAKGTTRSEVVKHLKAYLSREV